MQQTDQISPDGYWMWNGTQWVPNPYRPAAVPQQALPYESARFRASVTSILLASNIAGILLLTVAVLAVDLTANATDDQWLVIGLIILLALVVWGGTSIPTVVFFCMWLHRVVRNMPALGSPDPRWSSARAVVYCFIPFIWFVHPLRSVLDAWRGSDPSRRWVDVAARKAMGAPGLLAGWWATWLFGSYLSNIGSRFTGTTAAVLDTVGGVALVIAAVLCIMVLRQLTDRQDRKHELIASGQLV